MFITVRLLSKVKSKNVLVMCESLATGHKVNVVRERKGDKMEFIRYDPLLDGESLYREIKKLHSVKIELDLQKRRQTDELMDSI